MKSITKGFSKASDVLNTINPVVQANKNKKTNKLMYQSGQLTNNYLLPAAVEAGKPLYYTTAGIASTMATGNPIIGVALAKEAWNKMGGEQNDPSRNQKSNTLKEISKRIGSTSSKQISSSASGKGISNWVNHVKQYSKDNNISYKEAMKKAKSTYNK